MIRALTTEIWMCSWLTLLPDTVKHFKPALCEFCALGNLHY